MHNTIVVELKKVVLLAFVLVLLSLVSVAGFVRPVVDSLPIHNIDSNKVIAQTNSTTMVYLDPPTINGTVVGQEFTVNLNVRGAQDVYSWQAGIAFNPNVLNCTGFFEGQFLSNVGETFWVQGTVNNSVGLIRPCGCTLLGDLKASGDGRLAYVTFKVKSPGVSDLHLLDVLFADWIETQPGTWEPVMIPNNITDVFTIVVDTIPQTVIAVSNSTGSDGEYGSGFYDHAFSLPAEKISFKVTGPYPGWSNVTIPKTLLNVSTLDELRVAIDGILLSTGERTVTENATHYSIYFTYNAGIHYVQITTHALISGTISITLSSTSITLGSNVTVSGDIDPLRPSVTVAILYRYEAPEWVKFYRWTALGILTTDPNSHFNYTWTPKEVGTYEFMAMWEGDDSTFGDVSDVKTLTVKPKPKTWTVDDDELADFHAIQEAISAASPGDTIYVYNGTYCEHVVVNKSISLIGENKENTIVDGSRNGTVISVTADYVSIGELTIQNGYHIPHVTYGIKVGEWNDGCNNVTVSGNIISNNDQGIFLYYSNNDIVTNNTIFNNYRGISIVLSHNNYIEGNSLFNNGAGVVIGSDANSNVIRDNEICNNSFCGVHVGWSSGNKIVENALSFNNEAGIRLDASSNNNIIGNTITSSNRDGIVLFGSETNTIVCNELIQNKWDGIAVWYSNGNVIYHNNFQDHTKQAGIYSGSINIWDDGYPSGGNYWIDYTGTDANSGPYQNETGSDGIGDTPYIIGGNNQDHYPLMGMFSDFNATSEHHVQTICNSSISDFQFGGAAIGFNVSGENGTTSFCRICIPTALTNGTYKVFVNGTEVPHTLLPCSNNTHSYLYFTYNHSTHKVEIVPEFSPWTSMLIILIVLTVAIAIYKLRIPKRRAPDSTKTM